MNMYIFTVIFYSLQLLKLKCIGIICLIMIKIHVVMMVDFILPLPACLPACLPIFFPSFLPSDLTYLFLERGEGKEKDRERNIDVKEKHWTVASRMIQDQIEPSTQACALTGMELVTFRHTTWDSTSSLLFSSLSSFFFSFLPPSLPSFSL